MGVLRAALRGTNQAECRPGLGQTIPSGPWRARLGRAGTWTCIASPQAGVEGHDLDFRGLEMLSRVLCDCLPF